MVLPNTVRLVLHEGNAEQCATLLQLLVGKGIQCFTLDVSAHLLLGRGKGLDAVSLMGYALSPVKALVEAAKAAGIDLYKFKVWGRGGGQGAGSSLLARWLGAASAAAAASTQQAVAPACCTGGCPLRGGPGFERWQG